PAESRAVIATGCVTRGTPTGRENRKRRGSSIPLMSDGARSPDLADRAGTGDLHALRGRLTGGLVLPGDPEWDDARGAWNLAVDQRPVAIALVESVEDVVKVVEFAGEHGLRIAPQGTALGASALPRLA